MFSGLVDGAILCLNRDLPIRRVLKLWGSRESRLAFDKFRAVDRCKCRKHVGRVLDSRRPVAQQLCEHSSTKRGCTSNDTSYGAIVDDVIVCVPISCMITKMHCRAVSRGDMMIAPATSLVLGVPWKSSSS